jgi:hypothetical protein
MAASMTDDLLNDDMNFMLSQVFYSNKTNYQFCNKKVIIFESHHVQKKIAASHFKNAEKPPQIFHFL